MNTIYLGDCIEQMRRLPEHLAATCITSPPYYGLRDYGMEGQIGLEQSPDEYIQRLVEVFREVKRLLKPEGTLWVNIGDSYAGSGKGAWSNKDGQKESYVTDPNGKQAKMPKVWEGIKHKDLIGIPWMLAFALRADGWYLRQDIIWHKPNAMPESVTDRCCKAHEYVFLLSKAQQYYFDYEAIMEPAIRPGETNVFGGNGRKYTPKEGQPNYRGKHSQWGRSVTNGELRNRRSVWNIATKPYSEAHFAVFPQELIIPCIQAGSKAGDIVLDPFMGSGTTAVAALRLGRQFVGTELNPDYLAIAQRRIRPLLSQLQIF